MAIIHRCSNEKGKKNYENCRRSGQLVSFSFFASCVLDFVTHLCHRINAKTKNKWLPAVKSCFRFVFGTVNVTATGIKFKFAWVGRKVLIGNRSNSQIPDQRHQTPSRGVSLKFPQCIVAPYQCKRRKRSENSTENEQTHYLSFHVQRICLAKTENKGVGTGQDIVCAELSPWIVKRSSSKRVLNFHFVAREMSDSYYYYYCLDSPRHLRTHSEDK